MAFEKILNDDSITFLDESFSHTSDAVPTLLLINVNQRGKVPLVERSHTKALHITEGTLHRPDRYKEETVADKVLTTARTRTCAILGRMADVVPEIVSVLPYSQQLDAHIIAADKRHWPAAKSKLYLPTIVPVIVLGADPLEKYTVDWMEPCDVLQTLHSNFNAHHAPATRLAIEGLEVSIPAIEKYFSA